MLVSRALLFVPLALLTVADLAHGEGRVKFNRDVRPIMSDTCFHCHGPDKNSRKGGLRLDIREEALKAAKSGAIPIVPGKPDESEFVTRLFTTDEDDLMPPEDAHKTLTAEQKNTLKQWIAEGAEYEAHWAYTPLVKPPVPKLEGAPLPLDAFVREKLAEKKMTPSAEADRRTLLRRVSLDITGLPPTEAEMAAFLKDTSAGAYEKQVDRLLKSEHFGERMAVWWLDVARFTDTVGFHGDQNQRIFPYRDYVINAFNTNKPFSQFTLEQLAGDLLPNPTKEQLVATGFNRLNMMTREGGAQAKEYLAKYGADRVRTVGGAFLGATLGCSECHDHKFDPFTQKDFYAMQAFFADVKQWGVYSDYGYTPNAELKGYNNDYPFPPEVQVDSPYLKQKEKRLLSEISNVAAKANATIETGAAAKIAYGAWLNEMRALFARHADGWEPAVPEGLTRTEYVAPAKKGAKPKDPKLKDAKDAKEPDKALPPVRMEDDGRILFPSGGSDNATITIKPKPGYLASIQLRLLPHAEHKGSILRSGAAGNANVRLTASLMQKGATKPLPLAIRFADADEMEARYASGADVLGVQAGWKTPEKVWNKELKSVWLLEQPVQLQEGDILTVQLSENNVGCAQLLLSPVALVKPLAASEMTRVREALQKDDAVAKEAYLFSTGKDPQAMEQYRRLTAQVRECRDGKAWSMVTQAVENPLTVRLLPRGNWMDETGPVTPPAPPEFLQVSMRKTPAPPTPADTAARSTRMDLAKWLCSPENPLTPRAVMNRLWKQFFGNGLSIVVDDLGAQGEPPSHPELMDWLASEFRDSGWNVKHMIRTMVLSQTYRQSSSLRTEYATVDPNNRLLSSQNPRRLDAEFVRDNALSIAGLLNLEVGGPSAKPYQPGDYYENLQFPNRDYIADGDERQYRRGLYMHWQRTFLHPMLANFDAPGREECTASRIVSNTPQQALTLLNDPSFVEAARTFAVRVLKANSSADDVARLNGAFRIALGRSMTEKEKTSLEYFLNEQRAAWKADAPGADKFLHVGQQLPPAEMGDKTELAAWTSVCRVILNLHEVITRY